VPEPAALTVSDIGKRFEGVEALADISLAVRPGSIHGIVGPNGAGKTTLLNVITGYVRADRGTVCVDATDVTRWAPNRRVPLGLVRTFQNIRLFGGLTVEQNLRIGQHHRATSGFASLWPFATARERTLRVEVDECVERFGLAEYRRRRAGELPYGLQKQLELARALMAHPRLLLLDEPAAGMTEQDREAFVPRLKELCRTGVTIVIVEHDMNVISKSCDLVTVLNFGRLLAEGTPAETLSSADVRAAYVGV